ncbi:hypothetical protein V5O48_005540 [Marasmius crinis-equi]|uniref:Uncharacterized protein n=1 Tax=Marasmius crinis-equi TaxID=585013 RepID=A0ABR3FM01_9AGAR
MSQSTSMLPEAAAAKGFPQAAAGLIPMASSGARLREWNMSTSSAKPRKDNKTALDKHLRIDHFGVVLIVTDDEQAVLLIMADATRLYKGKHTNRSWAELPQEIVRMIATDYLFMISQSAYTPEQWESRLFWYNRVVYTAIRDARTMDKLMNICPQWTVALEVHPFWNHAVHALDPQDIFLRRNPAAIRQPPYTLYRTIAYHSCFICRVNSPQNSKGVLMAERYTVTHNLGSCGICREHRNNNNTAYCGLCLREGQPYELEAGVDPSFAVFCMLNEDEDTWPGVDATCRSCRSECLWKAVAQNPKQRDAVGGRRFRVQDWEARTSVECYLDLGEGTIRDVINTATERFWLRKHTRLKDMMSQALAASRFANAENEDELEMELSSELDDDDEEDMELLQLTEESGVKDLALGDWARHRILDGHWLNPADQWYGNKTFEVKAVHPCPWTIEADDSHTEDGAADDTEHPTAAVLDADIPPTFQLCELAFHAHRKQLRLVLLPAMKNIVRKIVIECGADGIDPALHASRMSLEDVMRDLRDEAVWFDGVDWLERRRNARREEARRSRDVGSDDHASTTGSSSGKSSDESSVTSPVLSTSTLQTTPSPPPLADGRDHAKSAERTARPETRPITIAVAPVLDPPRLIHPIPYVPLTATHLPSYSIESFKSTWREACGPLYHCRCKICARAQAKQAEAAGGTLNPQSQTANNKHSGTPTPGEEVKNAPPAQIQLREVSGVDAEGEPEVPFERSDEIDFDDDEFSDDLSDELSDIDDEGIRRYALKPNRVSRSRSRSPSLPPAQLTAHGLGQKDLGHRSHHRLRTPSPSVREGESDVSRSRPRKRSCDELGAAAAPLDLTQYHRGEPGTPPKRARREIPPSSIPPPFQFRPSPSPRKRGSEELDDGDNGTKRPKISFDEREREEDSGSGDSPPRSMTSASLEATEESDDVGDVGDDSGITVGPTSIGLVDGDSIPRSAAGDKGGRLEVHTPSTPVSKRAISPLPGR